MRTKSVAMTEGERMCTVITRVAKVRIKEGPASVTCRIDCWGRVKGSQDGYSEVSSSQVFTTVVLAATSMS
jgi:hypothetical protein